MISDGRLAQLMKTLSKSRPSLHMQVVIDIIGLMSDPADRNRYLSDVL